MTVNVLILVHEGKLADLGRDLPSAQSKAICSEVGRIAVSAVKDPTTMVHGNPLHLVVVCISGQIL